MSPTSNGVDIDIVIPAWGRHVSYLPETIASLLAQRGPTVRITVVDNASDDAVPPLADSVRVVRTERRLWVGAARNRGLDVAEAPYIMFWDADDLMLPGALARMLDVLEADPGVAAVTMDSLRWTPETGPGERWPWPRPIMYRLSRNRFVFGLIAQLYCPYTTTGPALFPTAAVRDAGGFSADIAFFEDWALAAAMTARGRVMMLRESGRLYRVHADSLSLGHLGHPDEGMWLRGLRRRMLRDARQPLWLKALLPLIRVQHWYRERKARRPTSGIGFYEEALKEVTRSDYGGP